MEKLFEQPNIVPPAPGGRLAPKMGEAQKAGRMSVGETFVKPRIMGGVFEGGTFRTSASGARIEILPKDDNTLGIASYDDVGVPVFTTKIFGPDIGDVILGDENAGKYVKWDKDAAILIINGVSLTDFVATNVATGSDLALMDWTSSLIFSATDKDTVAWTSGDLRFTDGEVFSISAGNTGNMTLTTYIFFSKGVSTTVLQTSTNPADTIGPNIIQLGVASPNASIFHKAKYQIYSGNGGASISVDQIAGNDSSTNEFVSATAEIKDAIVTYAKIQNVTDNRLIGRSAGTAGAPMEITIGAGLSLSGGQLSASITQYTDEMAQDAIDAMLISTNTIEFTYTDVTPQLEFNINYQNSTSVTLSEDGSGLKAVVTPDTCGLHHSLSITYISGTGTAGVDNTAQTVKTLVLPANTLTQVGDRMRIRCYWTGDTGSPVTGSTKVGPAASEVLVSHTTDGGAATLQLNEVWMHYIDNTHANIIENEAGALGALSAPNVSGFDWDSSQNIIFTQDQIANNHTILYALIVDVFPKGI